MNERLEQTALKFANDNSEIYETSNHGSMYFGFYWGAKWQQEQDKNKYSNSDMTNYALYILHNDVITPKQWFEQFKKK